MMQTADLLAILLSVLNGPVGWLMLLLVAGYVTVDLLRRRKLRQEGEAAAAGPSKRADTDRVGLHHDLSQFALGLSVLWALLVGFRLYLYLLRDLPEPFSSLTALDLVLTVGTLALWIGVYLAWRSYERRKRS
jgi:Ca2+/Na+ antiporter